jgi:membrane-bound lytic murein transglycosylase B
LATPRRRLAADGLTADALKRCSPTSAYDQPDLANAIVYRDTQIDWSMFLAEERLTRPGPSSPRIASCLRRQPPAGVPVEVVAAILMIESDFGAFRKLHPVFNVFVTLLWAAEPANFETVRAIIQKRLPDVSTEKVREKTKSKAAWAYEQLTYLLRIAEREKIDLPALEGRGPALDAAVHSVEFLGYAVDGSGDGARLYTTADAVFWWATTKSFGWKDGLTEERQRAVVRRYNNSERYAATVIAAAARIREGAAQTR